MSSLNLSDWALRHRSFIVFIMIAVTLAGVASFLSLGRAEDPPFTFRTMIVQAGWPGASMDDTLQQVTERLERKLQETRGLDFLRSYTIPGRTTIFVNLKGSTKASEVPDIWYQVRKNIGDIRGTLPAGVVGPGFNDDFGDTFGLIDHPEAMRLGATVTGRLQLEGGAGISVPASALTSIDRQPAGCL